MTIETTDSPGCPCRCGQHTLCDDEKVRRRGAMVHTRVYCGPERRLILDRRDP